MFTDQVRQPKEPIKFITLRENTKLDFLNNIVSGELQRCKIKRLHYYLDIYEFIRLEIIVAKILSFNLKRSTSFYYFTIDSISISDKIYYKFLSYIKQDIDFHIPDFTYKEFSNNNYAIFYFHSEYNLSIFNQWILDNESYISILTL